MAGLAAAWRLSGADDADLEITLYESSGILGGKGASVRGPHGRIEEHGLHVWLGYYDNSFRLMREVYDELDRPRVRPDCPIASIDDAFHKASRVGVMEHGPNGWSPWLSHFAENDEVPGSSESPPLDVADDCVSLGDRGHLGVDPERPPTRLANAAKRQVVVAEGAAELVGQILEGGHAGLGVGGRLVDRRGAAGGGGGAAGGQGDGGQGGQKHGALHGESPWWCGC